MESGEGIERIVESDVYRFLLFYVESGEGIESGRNSLRRASLSGFSVESGEGIERGRGSSQELGQIHARGIR